MALKFLKHLFGSGVDRKNVELFLTPDKLQQLFAYGHAQDCSGLGLSEDVAQGLVRLIDWQSKPRDWTILVDYKQFRVGERIVISPHIKWSNNPEFRYVGLEDGKLQFRDGESAYFLSEVTTDSAVISEIDNLFKFWYERLRLHEITTTAPADVTSMIVHSPIRGFDIVTVIYPNHDGASPNIFTSSEIATLLGENIERNWFASEPEFTRFCVTEVQGVELENEDASGFDFGPYDDTSDDFEWRVTLVVRQTAGGGFMLLMQETGAEYLAKIMPLFTMLQGVEGTA